MRPRVLAWVIVGLLVSLAFEGEHAVPPELAARTIMKALGLWLRTSGRRMSSMPGLSVQPP
jgi:hypothetical protein